MTKLVALLFVALLVGCAGPQTAPLMLVKERPKAGVDWKKMTTTTCKVTNQHLSEPTVKCTTVPTVPVVEFRDPSGKCLIEYKLQSVGISSGPMYEDLVPDYCKELRIQQMIGDEADRTSPSRSGR